MRCLALADALAVAGWSCAFAVGPKSAATVSRLAERIPELLQLASDDAIEPEALRAHWPTGCDFFIVDHYQRDAAFERACRPWARQVMVVDDLADRPHDCDILLDQTYGRSADGYTAVVPDGARLLLGPAYALIRPEFSATRSRALRRREGGGPVGRLLVSVGMSDPNNVTSHILEAIELSGLEVEVDVVLGAGAPHIAAIRDQIACLRQRATLHVDATEIAALMAGADLAIGSAGVSSWERCCLALPSVVVTAAMNQSLVAAALDRAGAALVLGSHDAVSTAQIAEALVEVVEDVDRRRQMASNAAALCDGRGVARVVAQLDPPRARDGQPVALRPVTLDDGELLLGWQTNPVTRRHFNNPRVPAAEEHRRWLENRLREDACIMNLIMYGDRPAGVVRLDLERSGCGDDVFEVSILVAPDAHGRGLGKAALKLTRLLVPEATLEASVHPQNEASMALFLGAGYVQCGDRLFNRPGAV